MYRQKEYLDHPDEEYDLTAEQQIKLKAFIERLNKEDERAYRFWQKLKVQGEALLKDGTIDDYAIETELSFFTADEKVNKKYGVEGGNPMVTYNSFLFFEDEADHLGANWIEGEHDPESPFFGVHFGYAVHCLFYHSCSRFYSTMSYHDMLAVDLIWFDVKMIYQFEHRGECMKD